MTIRIAMLALVALVASACITGEDEATETLAKSGFTNINVRSMSFWGCGEHDKKGREFTATNATGMRVEGVVCCGVWKSCTVRF